MTTELPGQRTTHFYKCGSVGYIRATVEIAKHVEAQGDIERRNAIALQLFKNSKNRTIRAENGDSVETYFDRKTKNFVTITKDSEQNQIGDADYNGHINSAAVAHLWALYRFLK